jgi:AraC-like DNA-binding protein
MDIRYDEWLPGSEQLTGVITAYWHVVGDGANFPPSAVLPDGHVELVFNAGDPVGLAGPSFTALQPARAVVGLLSKAFRLDYRGKVNTLGIRFHPARGAGFLGKTATELVERLLPLSQVCPCLDRAFARLLRLHRNFESVDFRDALDQVLLDQLGRALPPDTEVIAAVDALVRADTMPLVRQLAADLGISARQLQRRFRTIVGMTPKRFMRIVRFARVWQLASMSPRNAWAGLAAKHGFADQAHLVREFRAFGAEPPTQVFSADWYHATEMSRASGPAKGVRSVQDSRRRSKV